MKKQEGISWILDRPHTELLALIEKYGYHGYLKYYHESREKNYKENIDFVHSLGLKCDCVGWCYLEFDRPDIIEILDKIEAFCQKGNWLARGGYGCRYTDFDSDWYEIHSPSVDNVTRDGIPYAIYAYKLRSKPLLLGWSNRIPALASEKFRDVCIKHNIQGIDFCWAKDIGRYDSMQYAFMYPAVKIQTVACTQGLRYSDEYFPYHDGAGGTVYKHTHEYKPHNRGSDLYKRLQQIGGHLPRLAEIFYDFQFNLQDHYRKSDLPETGFAYIQGYNEGYSRSALLVHKETAAILIQEKMLNPNELFPVLTYEDEFPKGYEIRTYDDENTDTYDPELASKMDEEYSRIKRTERPKQKATTNMALKALREMKREHKEDFGKRMRKGVSDSLTETEYAPLIPYYLTADGGYLSDEYEFLNYTSAKERTAEYEIEQSAEELSETPHGIIFCKCADGDCVLLAENGKVFRISHEFPEISEEWPSLAQFFVDTIEAH